MKLPYTKQEDYLIPNIMIDMCFVLLNRNSIICLFCQLEVVKENCSSIPQYCHSHHRM